MIRFIAVFSLAYVVGSINFPIILFRLMGKQDPRSHFSKNPGATNVRRQAGLFWAGVVLALDMARAVCIAWAAIYFCGGDYIPWIGVGLIAGNLFPCFHGFKGGKGVANYLGFALFFIPWIAVASGAAWAVVYAVFRLPFVSSFSMVAILGAGMLAHFDWNLGASVGTGVTLVLIYQSHRSNIMGLFRS